MSAAAKEPEFPDSLLHFQSSQTQHPHWAAEGKKAGTSLQWVICCSIYGMTNAPYLSSASWVCAEQTSWQAAHVSQTLLVQNKTSWNFTLHFTCTRSWGSTDVKCRVHWMNKRAHLCSSLPFSLFLSLFSFGIFSLIYFRSPKTP